MRCIFSMHEETDKSKIFYISIIGCSIFYIFAIITNFALIFGLKKTNKTLTLSQKLYIYLSITDVATGILVPYYIITFHITPSAWCTANSIGVVIAIYTFGISVGTFLTISFLRNVAIRKPLYFIPSRIVYLWLAGWHVFIISMSLFGFFTYDPDYASHTLYITHWLFLGLAIILVISISATLNIWSTKVLARQSSISSTLNDIEFRRGKRNKTAVTILNILTLLLVLCVMPLSIYYIVLGIFMYRENEALVQSAYDMIMFLHMPLFPCSGLNALVYVLKNQKIMRFYRRCFSRRQIEETV